MKKMGKKFIAGTAFAAAALTAVGCGIEQPAPAVYGPPEWFESETATPFEPESAVTKPDATEPETTLPEVNTDNPVEDVYGPPSWFE